jgi:hypothetical protein
MVVKAKTERTRELMLQLGRFNAFKKNAFWLYAIGTFVAFSLSIYSFIKIRHNAGVFEFICVILFSLILVLFLQPVIGSLLMPFSTVRLNQATFGLIADYEFSDSGVIIHITHPNITERTELKYAYYSQVYESKDTFYLYTSAVGAYTIRKADIYEGSVADLQQLLRQNVSFGNYKVV